MERYQVIISYDGTDFHGFQRQGSQRTVQLEVEQALRRIGWKEKTIYAAGRTDTGVHGGGQVIAFDLEWSHSIDKLGKALNAFLPSDVGVCKVQKASPDFHPRFDALSRTYQYQIYFQQFRNPLLDRFAYLIWPKIDIEPLLEVAGIFEGTHDFGAFGRAMKPGGNTVRTVLQSKWTEVGDQFQYQITANAFLYHMVRRIVHVQILVALGKLTIDLVKQGIKENVEMPPGLAPANGLILQAVDYRNKEIGNKSYEE